MTTHASHSPTSHTPAAAAWHEEPLPSLRLAQTPLPYRRIAMTLALSILLTTAAALLLPWQQTATGKGRVIALAPMERPQTIDTPITGRVMKWYVTEGAHVRQGDPLLQVENNDPQWLARLEEQRAAAAEKVAAAQGKLEFYEDQVASLSDGREQDIASATERARAAEQAVDAAEQAVAAAHANNLQAQLNFERQRSLAADGIASQLDFEIARRVLETSQADVLSKQASLREKQADLASKRFDIQKIAQDDQAKIDSAQASRQAAAGDLATAQSDLAKARNALAAQQSALILAPRDGVVYRVLQATGTAQVKEGDVVASLVPDTRTPVVELYIDGLDVPLVMPGRRVRLQFEGWPAVQFAGWPSIAVGTFGGVVQVVDATDDGKGKFRVLVAPDPTEGPWPSQQIEAASQLAARAPASRFVSSLRAWYVVPQGTYLRQGVRVNGWVLLNRVPVWFEVWRQLNGFPPVAADESRTTGIADKIEKSVSDDVGAKSSEKKAKPPLPK